MKYLFAFLCMLYVLGSSSCWENYEIPSNTNGTITLNASPIEGWETAYAKLLNTYVNAAGFVDYDGLLKEKQTLEGIIVALAKVDPKGWNEQKKLAFWINAYNICMLWNVLSKYPGFKLVTEHGDLFFRTNRFAIAGQALTLDGIEHRVLRGKDEVDKAKDNPIVGISVSKLNPGIHVALSCAAISCPPIRNTLWKESTVEKDLERQLEVIFNNPSFVSLEGGKPSLLELFNWFFDDFKHNGKSVGEFFAQYVKNEDLKKALVAAGNDKSKFQFKTYNWGLNKQ